MTVSISPAAASPSALRSKPAVSDEDPQGDARRQAWQREMERAQLGAWFRPDAGLQDRHPDMPPPADQQASHSGEPSCDAQTHRAAMRLRTMCPDAPASEMADRAADAQPVVSSACAEMAARLGQLAARASAAQGAAAFMLAATTASMPQPGTLPFDLARSIGRMVDALRSDLAEAQEATPDQIDSQPTEHPSARDPVSVHMESHLEGVAVWIAMRADDPALMASLSGIVAELRELLQTRAQRLFQVVCNGTFVWRADADAGAHTPPSPDTLAAASDLLALRMRARLGAGLAEPEPADRLAEPSTPQGDS